LYVNKTGFFNILNKSNTWWMDLFG
jgi:hypothetical protein